MKPSLEILRDLYEKLKKLNFKFSDLVKRVTNLHF